MSDWALPLPRPMFSPLDVVLGILDEARRRVSQAVADAVLQHRLATLEDLVTRFVRETRTSFREVKGGDLGALMLAFGRENWASWSDTMQLALKMAEDSGVSIDEALEHGVDAFDSMARDAHVLMPYLQPETRICVRATVLLLAAIVERASDKVPLASAMDEFITKVQAPADSVEPGLIVLTTGMQILTVAGSHGGIDKRVSGEIATGLWQFFSLGAQDLGLKGEVIEGCFYSAQLAEAEASEKKALVEWAGRRRAQIQLLQEGMEHLRQLFAHPPEPTPALLKILAQANRG